jgi:protein-ribulosamine 3-kinase
MKDHPAADTPTLQGALRVRLAQALGAPVTVHRLRPIGGGGLHETFAAETSAGVFFVKTRPGAAGDVFEREREGLDALAAADCGLRIPRVVCVGREPALLVLEYLDSAPQVADFDERLGHGLAALHRTTAPQYGFAHDNHCGETPQPNGWLDDWNTFYRERRLRFQVSMLAGKGLIDADALALFERLFDRLPERLAGADEPPALIHGDLWPGNLVTGPDGAPALVDPAAYYGHREAELGMMVLFGGFSARVFAAYQAAWPLQPGWRERLPLYTLYHVLNHANLFGGAYIGQAIEVARRWG